MIFKKNIVLTFALGIAALLIGIFFRLYPLLYYTNASASEKATVFVLAQLKSSIAKQIDQTQPQLTPLQRTTLVKKSFDELLHKDGARVRQTIERVANEINGTNKKTPPYLLESDAYNFYYLTQKIAETGRISSEIKGSKYLNEFMLAPLGYYEPLNLHPYIGYFVYRFMKIFTPDISLMHGVAFTSLFIIPFSLIAFLFVCYNLRCSAVVSFIGSIFFLLSPIFIKRSSFGWYDSDPYSTFFPFIIIFFLFKSFDEIQSKKKLIFVCFSALLMVLYSLFWHGWVYLFSLIMLVLILKLLVQIFLDRNWSSAFQVGSVVMGYLLVTFIGIGCIFGFHDFFVLFAEGADALEKFMTPKLSLWPDMYISVGELRKASAADILELMGGFFFLLISVLGLLGWAWKLIREKKIFAADGFKYLMILLFYLSSLILTLGAQRFAILFLIPLSLFFVLGLQLVYENLSQIILRRQKMPARQKNFWRIALFLFLTASIVIPILNAHQKTLSLVNRIFNETWDHVLTKIKDQTPADSIINTWWPPGHFIKAIAHRRVTFDGATIDKPQAYWMANILLNTNEKNALGILRMLNDSGNLAIDYLLSKGLALSTSIQVLKEITQINRNEAQAKLSKILNPEQSNTLLDLTHRDPPPSYILIYNELVEKSLVLSFVDRWNFKKVEEINKDPELIKKIPARKSKEYVQFLWDIAGGPLNSAQPLATLSQKGPIILFEQNIQINLDNKTCRIDSAQFGQGTPQSLVYSDGKEVISKKFLDANLHYSLVLYKEADRYLCIVMDERLANSLLVKLNYFDGQGLKYLKLFAQEEDLTKRTRIKVFEVDWEEFLKAE